MAGRGRQFSRYASLHSGPSTSLGAERNPLIAQKRDEWGTRLYGDSVVSTAELTLPHPEMQGRRFVLEPLAEIAPGLVHPVLGVTVGEMLAGLSRGSAL